MKLVLKTLPPTTNHMYGRFRGGVYLKPEVRKAKEAIAWQARAQYRGEPLSGFLALKVCLFWPDRRKHDVDNIKSLLDSLNGILWEDDGQIQDLHTIKAYDKENPRVELTLETMPRQADA